HTNVSVVMQDANGYLETLSTTDKITPTSPVQVKSITLDTDMGDIVVSKDDTTTYTAGSTYTANIESLDINYSDNTFEKVTTEGNSYAIGQGKPVVTTVTIYDSLGGAHEIPIYFEKLPNSDEWKMVLGTTKITEANGTTLTLSLNDVKIKFAPNGKIAPGTSTGVLNVTYDNGAAPQTTMLDVEKLTLAAMPSTVTADTDGYTAGVCTKVTIDSSGVITAIYTNGEKRPEGQVSIAQFSNPSGLTQVKNGFFQVSNDSGIPVVGTATDLSVSITPGALEMSNVDVASEFSDMITSHRGFASNSKLITASDDMLEQLNNLIR
ncbi:MAG: flagellar hook-basal body complex protein, partial [Selenomonadaceae bacterium]|nr:flagellar hook-basal body complex protein [Selenomonadaceae bacterium]